MPDKVLSTTLTGRDLLSPVLAKAAASTRAFERDVEGSSKTVQASTRRAADTAQRELKRMGDTFEAEGRNSGGRLAQGIHLGLVRNSPLIVAGVAGALAAGAPAFIAGATTLFAGVGIVAAAQSEQVRSAWLGTWQEIAHGTVEASGPIQDVLVRMAGRVSQAFRDLRPQLNQAFADVAPQIETVTDAILRMGEDALPGMLRAVSNAGPVFDGLAHLLEVVGTGLGEFFNILADHAPAAGQAFAAIGDILGALLPVLGNLLGQGAELAAVVLPPLADALGAVADALDAIAPVLPVVASGFLALKVASSVTGLLAGLTTRLDIMASRSGAFAGIAGRMAGGLEAVSRAAGPAGAAIGFVAAGVVAWNDAAEKAAAFNQALARAFLVGGEQATAAGKVIDEFHRQTFGLFEDMPGWISNLGIFGHTIGDLVPSVENAKNAYKDFFQGLSDGQQATERVAIAQEALKSALRNHGPYSDEAATASARLADAQAEAARTADEEAGAIRGVTEAQAAQLDQARALIDAQFGFEDSLKDVSRLTQDYADAVKEHGRNSVEAADALDQLQRGYRDAGQAASDLAQSKLPASMDEQQAAVVGARNELAYYRDLLQQGIDLPPELDEHVAYLEAVVNGTPEAVLAQSELAGAIEGLGIAVERVPGEKSVRIQGEGTEELRQRLSDLGFTVKELPDGRFEVSADTDKAKSKLEGLTGELLDLDQTVADPSVDLDDAKFQRGKSAAKAGLTELDKSRAKPYADLDISRFIGAHASAQARVASLNGQRPTPQASLNDAKFNSIFAKVMGQVALVGRQNPTPTVGANDNASGIISRIIGLIGSVQSKTVTITTLHIDKYAIKQGLAAGGGQVGGLTYRSGGGLVQGPGGPTDDRALFVSSQGLVALSPEEWVVQAYSANRYGSERMAAVNAGTARVYAPGELAPAAMPGYGSSVSSSSTVTYDQRRTFGDINVGRAEDRRLADQMVRRLNENEWLTGG